MKTILAEHLTCTLGKSVSECLKSWTRLKKKGIKEIEGSEQTAAKLAIVDGKWKMENFRRNHCGYPCILIC